jgi:hypothetical protein
MISINHKANQMSPLPMQVAKNPDPPENRVKRNVIRNPRKQNRDAANKCIIMNILVIIIRESTI